MGSVLQSHVCESQRSAIENRSHKVEMTCNHEPHSHTLPSSQLYTEAVSVGLLLVPAWWAVSKLTTALRVNGAWKPAFDVALSGFLFHMTAEETGMNEWFLFHSYAAQKALSREHMFVWTRHNYVHPY